MTSVAYPDLLDKFKVTLDYSVPHVTARTAISNLNATKIDSSVALGINGNVSVGADASYDVNKGVLAKWSAGLLYTQGTVSVGPSGQDPDSLFWKKRGGIYAGNIFRTFCVLAITAPSFYLYMDRPSPRWSMAAQSRPRWRSSPTRYVFF